MDLQTTKMKSLELRRASYRSIGLDMIADCRLSKDLIGR